MADIDLIQVRRGTPTQRSTYVLKDGEPGWDGDALYIGDGVTAGGLPAAGAGGGLTQSVADARYIKLTQIGTDVATEAQGAKADTALQGLTAGTNVTLDLTDPMRPVISAAGGSSGVPSVFGRTGAVVAASGDYTFAQIGSKPTTLAGYGITDAATSSQGARADTAVQPGSLATVATTGAYSDLSGKPTIPTVPSNVSAFTNDAGYLTQHQSLAAYALASSIPTNNNQLTNGAGYVTTDTTYSVATTSVDGLMSAADKTKLDGLGGGGSYVLPVADASTLGGVKIGANVTITGGAISVAAPVISNAGLANGAGYITAASLSGYALTSQLFSGSYTDLTNKPTLFSGAYADLSGKPTLGTAAATDATAYATAAQGTRADAALRSVKPGANVTIDNTDPLNPVINSTAAGGGGGTVTSVALTSPSWLTVAGSPVTSAGTLALSATSGQAAKQFLATPNGATGAVGLRTIVASDIPTLNQATTGNAGSATKLATARTIAGVSFDGTANIAIPFSGIASPPTTLAGYGITNAATSAQGTKADTAVQPGALATVATTGAYGDLTGKPTIPAAQVNADWSAASGVAQILNKPTLGTAAAQPTTAFATAAQGTKADSAVQPGSLATVATSGAYSDLSGKPAIPDATSIPPKDITGDYTLSDADAGYRLRVNSAVGVTITDPGTLTPGKVILVQQIGTGQPTVSGANVVSFAATTKLAGQRAMATIIIDSSTVTYVNGELAAS